MDRRSFLKTVSPREPIQCVSNFSLSGFGAPVPRTPEGRGAAVVFAAVGIPLHFLLILNIGNLAAIRLQLFVLRKCTTGFPENAESPTPQPTWFKWFPLILIAFYYTLGKSDGFRSSFGYITLTEFSLQV